MKQIFPFTINNPLPPVKNITEITKYGYRDNSSDILDLSLGSCGCFPLGFKRTDIIDAVNTRLKQTPFCQSDFVTSNSVVEELTNKLYELSGGYYPIYSLSGSDAIEGAVKLVQMYFKGTGRKKMIGFTHSYHGSTYMSTSVSGMKSMIDVFGKHQDCIAIDHKDIENVLDETVAAVFIETASWGNDLDHTDKDYFQNLRKLCDKVGALLVIDDIAFCGGKTGTIFGFEKLGIHPDIFCVGKGISGGYFPLAATLCNRRVADIVKPQFLLHGYSYSFPMPGMISTLEYLKILDNENILSQHSSIVKRGNILMEGLINKGLISSYKSFGVCYSIRPTHDLKFNNQSSKVYYENGLHPGLWNNESSRTLIMMPIVYDEYYFETLESRLVSAITAQQFLSKSILAV